MAERRDFASDNTAPVHPAVLAALADANHGPAPAYGADDWTGRAEAWFRSEFGDEAHAFLVWNGTGGNVTGLQALLRPWQGVICSSHAHINVDECGAPERFGGCKLIDLPNPDGKLTPAHLEAALTGIGDQHRVQPAVVSITQSTEYGTVYRVAEIGALADAAHARGLRVHMDGARLANAVAALGTSVRACTRDAGVDILTFGATKNGGMGAEAVVVFDEQLAADLRYVRKQSGQLASKMRYLAAQFIALGRDGLWLRNAGHANAMARRLADRIAGCPGVRVTQAVDANAIFAVLSPDAVRTLQQDFRFHEWDVTTGEVRWMTSWATTADDVDAFADAIRRATDAG